MTGTSDAPTTRQWLGVHSLAGSHDGAKGNAGFSIAPTMGAMVRYSPEIAQEICRRLAEGESLNGICKDPEMPNEAAVRGWARDDVDGFGPKYARARDIGYDRLAEELLEIADTPQFGETITIKVDGTQERKQGDMIEHRRLRVDARKWMLAKMLPKKYGDKLDMTHSGAMSITLSSGDEET